MPKKYKAPLNSQPTNVHVVSHLTQRLAYVNASCICSMQIHYSLLYIVEIQTPTNVCISTILLQLTRWLAWGGLGWLVGVKKGNKKTPLFLEPFLTYLLLLLLLLLCSLSWEEEV